MRVWLFEGALQHVMRDLKLGMLLALIGLALGVSFILAPRESMAVNPVSVDKGIAYLRSHASGQQIGETAMVALALLKADVPPSDPTVSQCIDRIRGRIKSGGFEPERRPGADIYEAVVMSLALGLLGPEVSRGDLAVLSRFILGRQNSNGSWDYSGRAAGDTSISQYAVLGLWEAELAGVDIPPSAWDRAAQFFLSAQSASGGWNYHRDESDRYPDTIGMTAAGASSLLICKRQLAKYRRGGGEAPSALLVKLSVDNPTTKYTVSTTPARIDNAVKQGIAWISANFNLSNGLLLGPSSYYSLYGIERLGALADKDTLGRVNWFELGSGFIESKQRADGAWSSTHGDVPNTVWAVLFLTKSTAKTISKIQVNRLKAGTLLGGRGLPKDLTNITVAGGKVVSRPMNGAVEGMLAVLEDPRSENADSALAGLVERFRTQGPAVLKPHKERFFKLIKDRDPGVRGVAAWCLGRTDDLDVVPALLEAVTDPDELVVNLARDGLKLISRKIDGFGPGPGSTAGQRVEAANAWREWYNSVRPVQVDTQDALNLALPGAKK